ncbi:hypothetical protein B0H13DRAFT_1851141 [Mycena leptocephala]|nr:hypothetical protein B0H13DRAFT_1851141 [Mycena leptocephala]
MAVYGLQQALGVECSNLSMVQRAELRVKISGVHLSGKGGKPCCTSSTFDLDNASNHPPRSYSGGSYFVHCLSSYRFSNTGKLGDTRRIGEIVRQVDEELDRHLARILATIDFRMMCNPLNLMIRRTVIGYLHNRDPNFEDLEQPEQPTVFSECALHVLSSVRPRNSIPNQILASLNAEPNARWNRVTRFGCVVSDLAIEPGSDLALTDSGDSIDDSADFWKQDSVKTFAEPASPDTLRTKPRIFQSHESSSSGLLLEDVMILTTFRRLIRTFHVFFGVFALLTQIIFYFASNWDGHRESLGGPRPCWTDTTCPIDTTRLEEATDIPFTGTLSA